MTDPGKMPATETLRAFLVSARLGRGKFGQPEEPQEPQEQEARQVEATPDYKELLDRQDARIAELEAQVTKVAKSKEFAEALAAEIERVRAETAEEKVAYELRLAGAHNVVAAKALLGEPPGATWRSSRQRSRGCSRARRRRDAPRAPCLAHRPKRDALGLAEDLGPYFDVFVSFFCSGLLALYHQWERTIRSFPWRSLQRSPGLP